MSEKSFQEAYTYFNQRLFNNKLPNVMITLQHHSKFYGYFWQDKFVTRGNETETKIAEIAMNPDLFHGRSDKDILSTLVHEQVHCLQSMIGKPGKRGYHNKQWGVMMKAIGLHPSNTGQPGGKEIGEKMTHYIMPNHTFDIVCNELLASGYKLEWQSYAANPNKPKKKPTRAKFVCPECDQQAMAKPTAELLCGACSYEDETNDGNMVVFKMIPQSIEEESED